VLIVRRAGRCVKRGPLGSARGLAVSNRFRSSLVRVRSEASPGSVARGARRPAADEQERCTWGGGRVCSAPHGWGQQRDSGVGQKSRSRRIGGARSCDRGMPRCAPGAVPSRAGCVRATVARWGRGASRSSASVSRRARRPAGARRAGMRRARVHRGPASWLASALVGVMGGGAWAVSQTECSREPGKRPSS